MLSFRSKHSKFNKYPTNDYIYNQVLSTFYLIDYILKGFNLIRLYVYLLFMCSWNRFQPDLRHRIHNSLGGLNFSYLYFHGKHLKYITYELFQITIDLLK